HPIAFHRFLVRSEREERIQLFRRVCADEALGLDAGAHELSFPHFRDFQARRRNADSTAPPKDASLTVLVVGLHLIESLNSIESQERLDSSIDLCDGNLRLSNSRKKHFHYFQIKERIVA